MPRRSFWSLALLFGMTATVGLAVSAPRLLGQTQQSPAPAGTGLPNGPATADQVLRGRVLVASNGCSDCHNRGPVNVNDPNWLAGYTAGGTRGSFQIGPFKTYAKNLTPDKTTGVGMFSERQIFNALRYGLDPAMTPDGVISSNVPGQGNFPAMPDYLAPPMPWPSFRYKSDDDLWAIVAYLKHGIKPVGNQAPDSQGPPDNWASSYTADKIGPYPLPPYPAGNEMFQP